MLRAGVARDVNVAEFPYSGKPAPLIEVAPDADWINYATTFGTDGLVDVQLVVRLVLDTANQQTALTQLSDFCSVGLGTPSSIPDAIMNNRTLSEVVQDCVVLEARWVEDSDTLGQIVEFPLRIIARKQGSNY